MPEHLIPLTNTGFKQAENAGKKLKTYLGQSVSLLSLIQNI